MSTTTSATTITRTVVLPLLLMLLAVLAVSGALTGLTMWHDSVTCASNGGHYSVEGTTAWCRY